MAQLTLLVLATSLLLQIGAAAMALRLVRTTGWRAAWVLLGGAISLMAVRRSITLVRLVVRDDLSPDLGAELVALSISILMVLGIAGLAPIIEGVRRAEKEVRALVESAPEAMFVLDQQNHIVLANAEAGRLFGAFPHQLKGRDALSLFAEQSREAATAWLAQFRDTPRRTALSLDAGVYGLHALGKVFPIVVGINSLDTAEAGQAVVSIHDMTEYVESKRALLSSEGRFRSLRDDVLDNSSVGVCIVNADSKIAWVNRAFESYLGQDRDRVIGLDARHYVRDRLAPVFADPTGFAEKVLATYDDNTYTEHFECHVLESEGRWERWLEFWSQPLDMGTYQGGRIEQYADVTERHNAEQRIRQFVDIARNMQVGLLVYHLEDRADDKTLRIRIVNPFGERLLGLDVSELTGKYIDEAFPALREQGVPAMFAEVIHSGESREVRHFEFGGVAWSFKAFALPDDCVGILFDREEE